MNYKHYNDYELIYMVREKDDYSRGLLYEKYLPIIRSMVYDFYLNYQQYGYEYEDFLQEALLSFESGLLKYDEEQDTLFYTFIMMCVRRSLLTFCRNISNESKNISNTKLLDIDKCNVADELDIEKALDIKENDELFREALYELPFDCSIVMELKYNGFTYREIGELLDIPYSTAEFKIRKARKYLKKVFRKNSCK